MEKYIPDIYQKSIYTINYDTLYNRGIRCLLIDLDNTIVPITMKKPNKKVKELFDDLKTKGFKVIIFSNSPKSRVKPFKDELDVDCCAFALKPFKFKYNTIICLNINFYLIFKTNLILKKLFLLNYKSVISY